MGFTVDPAICNLDKLADSMEEYVNVIERYVIIDGITEDEKKKYIKTIRKAIKKIRKGEYEDVISKKRYHEFLRNLSNRDNDDDDD